MVIIEPGLPDPVRRALLRLDDQYAPLQPVSPVRIPAFETGDLPDPTKFPYTVAFDKTVGALVTSNGSAWV